MDAYPTYTDDWYATSDTAIVARLGTYIREQRRRQHLTQQEVATNAGIDRNTLVNIENGKGCTLLVYVQVLRVLRLLDALDTFIATTAQLSPMQLAAEQQKAYRRKSTKK
jgi:DNA-binding XRE family transcriptional regulator